MQHLTELSCWNSHSWNQIHEELAMVHVILWVLELALSFSSYAGCVEKKKSVASPLPTGYSESLITPLRNYNLKWTSSKTISNIKFEGVMGHLISQHLSYLCHYTLFCSNRWLILKSSVWDSLLLKFTRHKHHTWTLWAPFSLIAYYPVKALNCRDFSTGSAHLSEAISLGSGDWESVSRDLWVTNPQWSTGQGCEFWCTGYKYIWMAYMHMFSCAAGFSFIHHQIFIE